MMIINATMPPILLMDKETIGALASFPLEKQALVKGFILGLLERDSSTQRAMSTASGNVRNSA